MAFGSTYCRRLDRSRMVIQNRKIGGIKTKPAGNSMLINPFHKVYFLPC